MEIKFRGFSKYDNKMRNINRMNFNNDKLMFEGMNVNWSKSETIIMQYTGLKDCNGVDIYEGDILKDKYGYIAKVFWDDSNARFETMDIDENIEIFEVWVTCEIIGNVHENPELLKER